MNYTGLYTAHKLNRPLTDQEKNGRFYQGKRRRVNTFNDEASVIRMNSNCLETVCKYYSGIGVAGSMLFPVFFILLIGVFWGGRSVYNILSGDGLGSAFVESIATFVFIVFAFFIAKLINKEWFRKTHYPIRFNRKNQMVYVYKVSGEILSVPWKDIFFTPAKSLGRTSEWGIDGHILAEDGETVIDTFSLAVSLTAGKKLLGEYWEFIRCYMEEDCVQELSELVTLCPPVEEKKEGYIFGLQYLMKMNSRLEWIFLPVMFPLDLLASFSRYIAMRTSKIPQWPQEVLDACQPEHDDPIDVSAANNPKHLWRYVLANEKRDVYEARYARQKAAYERIKEKLDLRYSK